MTTSFRIEEQSYKEVQELLRRLRMDLPRKAIGSMSKSLTKVKQLMVNKTYEIVNLTKTRITQDITVQLSGDLMGSDIGKFSMAVSSTGKPIGLVQFAISNPEAWDWVKPTPIKVRIYRKGSISIFDHAFIAKGSGASVSSYSGETKLHIWERRDRMDGPYYPGKPYSLMPWEYRFPVKRMSSIRIQDVQDKSEFISSMLAEGSDIVINDLHGIITEVLV